MSLVEPAPSPAILSLTLALENPKEPPCHVALVRSGREAAVAASLTQTHRTFYPKLRVVTHRFGQKVERLVPMVSGYVFVWFAGPEAWHRVRRTEGVYAVLGDDEPVTISGWFQDNGRDGRRWVTLEEWMSEFDATGARLVEASEIADTSINYVAGDCVRILSGPFSGFFGRVTWLDRYVARLETRIFGRDTATTVEHGSLLRATRREAEDAGMLRPSYRSPGSGKKSVYAGARV
jgi:transcription antitermination factor NusG